ICRRIKQIDRVRNGRECWIITLSFRTKREILITFEITAIIIKVSPSQDSLEITNESGMIKQGDR
ncbi:MAG: hypothetical protein U9R42_00340, partial [Bacteroidota bacterium]|nr:hypothetical protein [Bacteroidota bacterium]